MAGAAPSDLGRTALSRPTIEFLRYLLGRRTAGTTVTVAETELLVKLAQGRRCVVEVGVFEGATSARLAAAIAPTGRLFLVDPFERGTRPDHEDPTGPVRLLREILAGEHGPWNLAGEADSVSAIRRAE